MYATNENTQVNFTYYIRDLYDLLINAMDVLL